MSEYVTKDSGQRQEFNSGMVRDTDDGKTLWHLVASGPMLERWAKLLTRGAVKYEPDNWMKAEGLEELDRFRASAFRHFMQWFFGEQDEDHAAAVMFNINGAEYVEDKLAGNVSVRGTIVHGDLEVDEFEEDIDLADLIEAGTVSVDALKDDFGLAGLADFVDEMKDVAFRRALLADGVAYPDTPFHDLDSRSEVQTHSLAGQDRPHFHIDPAPGSSERVFVPRDHDTPHPEGPDCTNCVRLAGTSKFFKSEDISGTCWCLVDGDPDTCFKHSTDRAVD